MSGKVRYTSRFERISIVSLALFLVVFVYGQFISDLIGNYNWAVDEEQASLARQAGNQTLSFGFGPPGYFVALFHLSSLPIFLALALGRKFYTALVLTLAYLVTLFFAISFHIERFARVDFGAPSVSRFLTIGLKGLLWDPFNLLALIILPALLVWEISIVTRVRRQTVNASKLR